ncbi:MAG: tripartite tricarboxylate transporter substrate binding protein [Achromobacter sp.]|uniref:Bug family tripartite tricarboxylate transporter substrate binding protein n=1 Tax=Achromobacter sp. TaxID=134375 RepID=UPI002590C2B9|nr:tripartite tricarboxylate transporter substrate binding protein [Achromobacter sp.]MCW0210359.1 tripartite tricarboxylate transporter substrate binding protein [Achromobacter sp.]
MKLKMLYAFALAVCSCAAAPAASAAGPSYPEAGRPISVVVPFGAGSGTDVITRIILSGMSKDLGGNFIVLNKAGASGQIGTEFVARAQPDGYTLLVATNSTHSGNPFLYKSLRYDAVKDFAPIGRMTINPLAFLVKADSPFKTAADVIGYARQNPGKLTYGYGNTGGQVSAAMLVHMAKINTIAVPYKTTPQLFTDIVSGQVDFGFVDFAASRPLIDGGKLRSLATTSEERLAFAPAMPAVNETPGLKEFRLYAWLGLMAPAGTPPAIVERLNRALNAALDTPEIRKQLEEQTSSVVKTTTLPEFQSFLSEQRNLWMTSIQTAGIEPQ